MNVHVDPNCMAAATAAAKGSLTTQEILEAFDNIHQRRMVLEAEGHLTGKAERLRRIAAEQGERTKIAAAMQRRHAALNVLIRDKVDRQVSGMIASGLKPHQALRAVLEGINSPAAGSRASAAANVQAYEARYLGGFLSDLERDNPHLVAMLGDQKLDADVKREMSELRPDDMMGPSRVGITGNKDAIYLAKKFADYAEMSRTDANRLGASIGKLNGWTGPQVHDDIKMMAAGKAAWVGRVATLLDIDRTFPEGVTSGEAAEALGSIYDTIVTGVSNKASGPEMGQRVNPANLAKSLGKSRVLHFADADAALTYQTEFGYSNTIAGMFFHLRQIAGVAGVMETLGPNPEVMFSAIAAKMQRDIRNSTTIPDDQKQIQIDALSTDAGALRQALDVATGMVTRPVKVTAARIGSDIRAVQSMAKLGAAVVSSVGDIVTAAAASQFRGSGFLRGLGTQLRGIMQGRPKGEQGEIAYLLGEGFDGLVGHIASAAAANDGPRGVMGGLQEKFFRWNGLTWWTDVNRAVAGRAIAAELGMRAGTAFDALPSAFRNVLVQANITPEDWAVLGKAALRVDGGNSYLTPDRVREIPDADIATLAPARIAAAKGDPERIAIIIADTRRQLEIKMSAYVADQTSSAIIEADARTRRYTTLGTRPGTLAGEVIRYVMQFKGYPLAFTTRIGGRALFAHGKDASFLDRSAHIGSLVAGLTVAGYMSMTAKDMLKGYWPPRNPMDPKVIMAAMQQGGAWGIYGDFLFSQTNRFGGGLLATALGPTFGTAGDAWDIFNDARDLAMSGGEDSFSASKAFTLAMGNVPFANLHLLKPAMDFLFVNSIREALSPGYLRRQRKTRMTEYGQTKMLPDRAFQ